MYSPAPHSPTGIMLLRQPMSVSFVPLTPSTLAHFSSIWPLSTCLSLFPSQRGSTEGKKTAKPTQHRSANTHRLLFSNLCSSQTHKAFCLLFAVVYLISLPNISMTDSYLKLTLIEKCHIVCVSFWVAPCSHSPPLISLFLHLSWWVLSESCQGICVCPPSSPHYSPWGGRLHIPHLRESPPAMLWCALLPLEESPWRLLSPRMMSHHLLHPAARRDGPLAGRWTPKCDTRSWEKTGGRRRYKRLQGTERWLWGISINTTRLQVMRVEHMQTWNA